MRNSDLSHHLSRLFSYPEKSQNMYGISGFLPQKVGITFSCIMKISFIQGGAI